MTNPHSATRADPMLREMHDLACAALQPLRGPEAHRLIDICEAISACRHTERVARRSAYSAYGQALSAVEITAHSDTHHDWRDGCVDELSGEPNEIF